MTARNIASAQNAARSMRGSCVELIDILTRLHGANMADLASLMPSEFSALHRYLAEARNAALQLDATRKELRSGDLDV